MEDVKDIPEPCVDIKVENDEIQLNIDKFVQDAKSLDPELLTATLGPILHPRISLWDVLVQKMNSIESSEMNKVFECIQMVLSEMRHLLNEVQGLLSSCVKDNEGIQNLLSYSDQLSSYLIHDLIIEPKDVLEIPQYYLGMICDVKIEHDFEDIDQNISDSDEKPDIKRVKKNGGQSKKRKRPNLKDVPPDMKVSLEAEESICESRRRRYCEICTKGFGNQKRLDTHMTNGECPGKPNPKWHYTNMTAKRLFCIHPDCLPPSGVFDINYLENSFNSGCIARGYYTHVMEKHATPENSVFPCDSCDLKFPNTYILKYHKDYCGDNFTCRFCGRGIPSKRGLVQHEASHNLRAFKCPHCDHATNRKSLLEMHIKSVHLNLRPEICQLCGKAFKTKKQIAAHILTHSDAKRYSCEICGAKLKNVTCYRSHMMNVHKQRVACDICGITMFKEEGIRRHKRQVHGIDLFEVKSSK